MIFGNQALFPCASLLSGEKNLPIRSNLMLHTCTLYIAIPLIQMQIYMYWYFCRVTLTIIIMACRQWDTRWPNG